MVLVPRAANASGLFGLSRWVLASTCCFAWNPEPALQHPTIEGKGTSLSTPCHRRKRTRPDIYLPPRAGMLVYGEHPFFHGPLRKIELGSTRRSRNTIVVASARVGEPSRSPPIARPGGKPFQQSQRYVFLSLCAVQSAWQSAFGSKGVPRLSTASSHTASLRATASVARFLLPRAISRSCKAASSAFQRGANLAASISTV